MARVHLDAVALVLPVTVHVIGVDEAKMTVRPEVAVAVSGIGVVDTTWFDGPVNEIVCGWRCKM